MQYRMIYDAREMLLPDWAGFAIMLALAFAGLVIWGIGVLDEWLWSPARVAGRVPDDLPPPMLAHRGVDRLGQARLFRQWGPRMAGALAAVALVIGVLEFSRHAGLRHALQRGDYTVVEGTVYDFERGDRGGHRDERFSVRSGGRVHTYRYSHARGVPGWHQSHGPLRAGLRVRIADVDGAIARLEIAR